MSNIHNIDMFDSRVKTIVVYRQCEFNQYLPEFISTIGSYGCVVGLDIELPFQNYCMHPPMIKLSTRRCCLLLKIDTTHSVPCQLAKLFTLPNVTFVCVNVKFCADVLETLKLKVRNLVDLGQLAADVQSKSHLKHCGLAKLFSSIHVEADYPLGVGFPEDFFCYCHTSGLNNEAVKRMTTNAFVAFLLGDELLGGCDRSYPFI